MAENRRHIHCERCGRKLGYIIDRHPYFTVPFRPLPKYMVTFYMGKEDRFLRLPRRPICEECPTKEGSK